MSGPVLGEDGTLRDASELEWCHSASPTPNLSPLATPDLCKKMSPMKSKEKKKRKNLHPNCPITSAISNNSKKAASKKKSNCS